MENKQQAVEVKSEWIAPSVEVLEVAAETEQFGGNISDITNLQTGLS